MDVGGAEFQLGPRLVETGPICLMDELFVECRHDRRSWCSGERSAKLSFTGLIDSAWTCFRVSERVESLYINGGDCLTVARVGYFL